MLIRGNSRGITLGAPATALFAIVAAMAKVAVNGYRVLRISFFRQIVAFGVSTAPVFNFTLVNGAALGGIAIEDPDESL